MTLTIDERYLAAAAEGDLDGVRVALAAGARIDARDRDEASAILHAARGGHLEVVRYLLENTRVNVNLTNNLGWTALIETVILGDGGPVRRRIVELLLEHGARADLTDPWGASPAELARERGFDDIAAVIERARP